MPRYAARIGADRPVVRAAFEARVVSVLGLSEIEQFNRQGE